MSEAALNRFARMAAIRAESSHRRCHFPGCGAPWASFGFDNGRRWFCRSHVERGDDGRFEPRRKTAAISKRFPPPTDGERAQARTAALALRQALLDPSTMGERSVLHIDLARPRRGEWHETWANLPGLARVNGRGGRHTHVCLPGWTYSEAEVRTEMIPDLEVLAERGERPTEATSAA